MQELSLGYPKHPPLPAFILWLWFSVFPVSEWAYTLLAVVNIAIGLYFAFRLCGEWLHAEKRAAVMLLLAVIPFYNFLGFKFDQNSLLIPLWALAMWGLVRSLDGGRLGWAVLCGAAAAGAMLTKYWSLFLMLAMATTVLFDQRRNAYFRSPAPYVAAAVFLILTVPHLVWLIQNDFPPLRWVGVRRTAHSPIFWWRAFTNYILGTVAYGSAAVLLFFARDAAVVSGDLGFALAFRPDAPPPHNTALLGSPACTADRCDRAQHTADFAMEYSGAQSAARRAPELGQDQASALQREGDGDRGAELSACDDSGGALCCLLQDPLQRGESQFIRRPCWQRRRCAMACQDIGAVAHFSQARSGWLRPHPPICRNIRSSIRISRAICRPGSISNASTGRAWRLSSRPMTHVGFARCANGRAAPTSRKCR